MLFVHEGKRHCIWNASDNRSTISRLSQFSILSYKKQDLHDMLSNGNWLHCTIYKEITSCVCKGSGGI